jgi:SAM-dependent methyltransferase
MHNCYDQIAEQWHANIRDQSYVDRVLGYVDLVLKDLLSGARVLDLGCGTGSPIAKYISEKGFLVTCVDQSAKMLEIAKSVVPEAELIHGDMVEVNLPEKFAAAIAWDSIFHVERKYHSAIFRKLAGSLENRGRLLISLGGSDALSKVDDSSSRIDLDAEGFTSAMFGHTFFYSGYEPQMARRLIEAEGFQIEHWEIDDPTSRGHIAAIARRVATAL